MGYQWIFVDSGFIGFISQGVTQGGHANTVLTQEISAAGQWLLTHLRDFLQATVYITVVFVVRVSILVLSVPLFVMVVMVAMVEGLSRRDLRRYGAGYESSFCIIMPSGLSDPLLSTPACSTCPGQRQFIQI